jgi:hypothetical protein
MHWRRLPDFVTEISNFTQKPQYLHKYNHFVIHEIFRPHGVTNPVDFVVNFGRAALRLGSFASTTIGSAAIRDLFTSPYFPQLKKESIEQGIEVWCDRADRTADAQEGQGTVYEVSPSPVSRRVRWNSGIECDYTFDSLVQPRRDGLRWAYQSLDLRSKVVEGGRSRSKKWRESLANIRQVVGGMSSALCLYVGGRRSSRVVLALLQWLHGRLNMFLWVCIVMFR